MLKPYNRAVVLSLLYALGVCFTLFLQPLFFKTIIVLPFVLVFVYLLLYNSEFFFKSVFFLIPLSVTLSEMGLNQNFDLSLPTEPLMFVILLLLIFHQFYYGFISRQLIHHPISIIIIAILVWALITTVTSSLVVVSAKNFTAKLWFIVTGFFAGHILFRKGKENMHAYMWLNIIPLTLVIVYTLFNHFSYGFTEDSADWVATPFYKDHTIYGACVALSFPVLVGYLFQSNYAGIKRFFIILLITIHAVAITYSYTRAAWLSIAGAFVVFLFLFFKVKVKTIFALSALSLLVVLFFQTEIIQKLSANKQDSEVNNLGQNVQSVSNISTDVSNLERINRWKCAVRMFRDRPIFGFGPGTYMFNYAPYQIRKEKTVISTDFADGGNAHSEYLGPLCEQGFLGAALMLALLVCVVCYGFKLVYLTKNRNDKIFIGSVFIGLITYFSHGFLNNYLDVDKAAVPFWTFIAIIVNYDIYLLEKKVDHFEKG